VKYVVNSAAFLTWSKEMAYWLGFLFADGCVFMRRRKTGTTEHLLQVKLRTGDTGHLHRCKDWLGYTGPVKHPTEASASLCIYNKDLVKSLVQLGMSYRKTYAGVTIPLMPARCILPFAQGAYDGNGSLSRDDDGLKISLSGPAGLPQWFRVQVATHVELARGGSLFKRGPMYDVAWHGDRQVPHIASWVMHDTGVARLPRVMHKYDATMEVCHS